MEARQTNDRTLRQDRQAMGENAGDTDKGGMTEHGNETDKGRPLSSLKRMKTNVKFRCIRILILMQLHA